MAAVIAEVESARRMKSAARRLSLFLRAHPLLVIPLFLALYGAATIDVSDFRLLSAAPLQLHVDPTRQFLQFSPLPFVLGYPVTRAVGPAWSFWIVMLGGLIFCAAALRRCAAVRYGSRRNDAMLMVFATPLLIVLSQYIGKSDPFMVAFLLLLVASRHPIVQILIACLVVLSHLEIGLLALGSAMFLRIVPFRWATLGAITGVLLVFGYHQYLLPAPPQSRADMGVEYLSAAVAAVLSTPVLHLVSMFGPFWCCVFTAPRLGWRWLTVVVATTVVASATLDFTRVFILVGLPLVIAIVDRVVPRADQPASDDGRPGWFNILPLFAFVQVHLLSTYVYDSRMPGLIGRLFASF
jgi:hypothetical protein